MERYTTVGENIQETWAYWQKKLYFWWTTPTGCQSLTFRRPSWQMMSTFEEDCNGQSFLQFYRKSPLHTLQYSQATESCKSFFQFNCYMGVLYCISFWHSIVGYVVVGAREYSTPDFISSFQGQRPESFTGLPCPCQSVWVFIQ